jgi:hypothetical protein
MRPATVMSGKKISLQKRLGTFLNKKRYAVRTVDDSLHEFPREGPACYPLDKCRRVLLREPVQYCRGNVRLAYPRCAKLWAERQQ